MASAAPDERAIGVSCRPGPPGCKGAAAAGGSTFFTYTTRSRFSLGSWRQPERDHAHGYNGREFMDPLKEDATRCCLLGGEGSELPLSAHDYRRSKGPRGVATAQVC